MDDLLLCETLDLNSGHMTGSRNLGGQLHAESTTANVFVLEVYSVWVCESIGEARVSQSKNARSPPPQKPQGLGIFDSKSPFLGLREMGFRLRNPLSKILWVLGPVQC